MEHLLYGELSSWYRLLDPPESHADEASVFERALVEACDGKSKTLLELGAGAGHNAAHLSSHFDCTLSDLSEPMLALSRELNPACEHLLGDMRTLRLERSFDAVLVHDAICYMTTESDLRAAIQTAYLHTRPGGAAVFAPDHLTEGFRETSEMSEAQEGTRAMRCLEWMWDPDPGDTSYTTDYAFLLRDGRELRAIHDRHVEGLFDRRTWMRLFREVGYEVSLVERPIGGGETDEVFSCHRPPG